MKGFFSSIANPGMRGQRVRSGPWRLSSASSQSRFEHQLTTLRDQDLKPLIIGFLKTTITEQSNENSLQLR